MVPVTGSVCMYIGARSCQIHVAVQYKACHRVGSSTVPARVGIRRHIGTESYRFGRQYGASDRVVRVP